MYIYTYAWERLFYGLRCRNHSHMDQKLLSCEVFMSLIRKNDFRWVKQSVSKTQVKIFAFRKNVKALSADPCRMTLAQSSVHRGSHDYGFPQAQELQSVLLLSGDKTLSWKPKLSLIAFSQKSYGIMSWSTCYQVNWSCKWLFPSSLSPQLETLLPL